MSLDYPSETLSTATPESQEQHFDRIEVTYDPGDLRVVDLVNQWMIVRQHKTYSGDRPVIEEKLGGMQLAFVPNTMADTGYVGERVYRVAIASGNRQRRDSTYWTHKLHCANAPLWLQDATAVHKRIVVTADIPTRRRARSMLCEIIAGARDN